MYILTFLHIIVGVGFLLAFLKKKRTLFLHIGIGALGIGAGMLVMMIGLLYFSAK